MIWIRDNGVKMKIETVTKKQLYLLITLGKTRRNFF